MVSIETLTTTFKWLKGNTSNNLQTKEELAKAFRLSGRNPSKKSLDQFWAQTNGSVTFEEFTQLARRQDPFQVESLLQAFARLGGNSQGLIDYDILKRTLMSGSAPLNEEELEVILGSTATESGHMDYLRLTSAIVATLALVERSTTNEDCGQDQADSIPRSVDSRTFTRRRGSNRSENFSESENNFLIPSEYRSWNSVCCGGTVFAEGQQQQQQPGSFASHQYLLTLDADSDLWLSIRPLTGNCDLEVLLFSEQEGSSRNLAASTQRKDAMGNYVLEAHLSTGQYLLVPFTSGCRLKSVGEDFSPSENSWTPLRLNSGHPTAQLLEALREVFRSADLDLNGSLSYEEFNLFSAWTNGEMAAEDEWENLKCNFPSTPQGELTEEGFVQVHLAQLMEQDGEVEMWAMLRKMGFNSNLVRDQAFPFALCVQSESSIALLRSLPISPVGAVVERTLCRILTEQGAISRVKNMNDLSLHHLALPHRTTYAVRNKSHSAVLMRLDCSGSTNCRSHRGTLNLTTQVPPKTCLIAHHLIADDERLPWTASCQEMFIK